MRTCNTEMGGVGLNDALAISPAHVALCAHAGYVYLVAWHEDAPLYGDLYHGALYCYSVQAELGLQPSPGCYLDFVELAKCRRFLAAASVPLHTGWLPVEARPAVLL